MLISPSFPIGFPWSSDQTILYHPAVINVQHSVECWVLYLRVCAFIQLGAHSQTADLGFSSSIWVPLWRNSQPKRSVALLCSVLDLSVGWLKWRTDFGILGIPILDTTRYCWNANYNILLRTGLVIGNHLIGLRIFSQSLNADGYLNFRQNDFLRWIKNFDLEYKKTLINMQDGAPPHRVTIITTYLNEHFPNKWFGYGSSYVQWPSQSPNLTPLDFYLCGHLKTLVYRTPIKLHDQLVQ